MQSYSPIITAAYGLYNTQTLASFTMLHITVHKLSNFCYNPMHIKTGDWNNSEQPEHSYFYDLWYCVI